MYMKKIIMLSCTFILIAHVAICQAIFPASKTFKPDGFLIFNLKNATNKDSLQHLRNDADKAGESLFNIMEQGTGDFVLDSVAKTLSKKEKRRRKNENQLKDSIYRAYLDMAYNNSLPEIVSSLNETPTIRPTVTAGFINIENTQNAFGNINFGIQYRLSEYKIGHNNWIDPHYLYVMFGARTTQSQDTQSIQKSFLFPELNKRDFVLGYFCEFQKKDWSISPTLEFSVNRFNDSLNQKYFVSQSFTAGIKVQKVFKAESLTSFFCLYPYYSLIAVDKKYSDDFKVLIKEPGIHPTFHSLGLHVSAQLPSGVFFCDMKYILNKQGAIGSPDLKRHSYTVGTLLGF